MSDTDRSLYNIRYNQVTQGMEGFGGGTPQWTPLTLVADGGLNQLTGDVTAGPGTGSQVATIANGAITNAKVNATAAIAFSKLAALPSADILVGNGSNVATAVALSGDATLSNAGALTLATVNGNVGSFTSANITVDAKGRITAAANGSGATPAGANTQIQFNNSGAFGASANLTWNGSTLFTTGTLEADTKVLTAVLQAATIVGNSSLVVKPLGDSTTAIQLQNSTSGVIVDLDTTNNLVGIGGTPNLSAKLDVQSTTHGLLPPRMSTAQRDAIVSPATGLQIYNTDNLAIEEWDGSNWQSFGNTILLSDGGTLTASGSLNVYADGLSSALPSIALRPNSLDPGFANGDIRVFSSTVQIRDSSEAVTPAAVLQLTSTTAGFLPPRMSTTQKNAIPSPDEGLVVYDLTLHKLSVWTGATWETVTSA